MQLHIVTIKDRATESFGVPMFMKALGQAIRGFTDEVNNEYESNQMYHHPDDFDLYDLGVFNDSNCHFSLHDEPVMLIRGKDVKLTK
jgi:hypothetical protein